MLFTKAASFNIFITSFLRPIAKSHLGDSGRIHLRKGNQFLSTEFYELIDITYHKPTYKKPGNDTANCNCRQSLNKYPIPVPVM